MIQSLLDTNVGNKEFDLMVDQEHLEEVWSTIEQNILKYIENYLDGIAHYKSQSKESFNEFLKDIIKKNDTLHNKYHKLFDLELMEEEYAEDTESFKSITLKKECDVIKNTLKNRSESLNEWKSKFYSCNDQILYDTFYNMMTFAAEYDEEMDESAMEKLDNIEDCRLSEMVNNACYKTGVIGFGIVANILNHMYPRTFPGNYKAGLYSLYFFSERKAIDMPSNTSEFCMVKDNENSKIGVINQTVRKTTLEEHNYYFPYETFCIYTIRIYHLIIESIRIRLNKEYINDYRFLLTNDFYDYVISKNEHIIESMIGKDDNELKKRKSILEK